MAKENLNNGRILPKVGMPKSLHLHILYAIYSTMLHAATENHTRHDILTGGLHRVKLTIAKRPDSEEIKVGVLRRSDLWHEALEHLVAFVGGVVHQDLVPDEEQSHSFLSQL